ncbi:unnamed protein product [Spirodela intermedia]|uniref:poly(A)-specific ribonuclease n=1 Tax=Spirodela intermedia TaxID=51605 RepID=A0A7I8JLD5_SPIIN|nr:unnamed protein product [Spirodela intermedia]CAA6670969.1 unnamed protein product [Spirodela intermedia]
MSAVAEGDDGVQIRDVWGDNLEDEFAMIRDIVDDFPYVAMDTEFPGIVMNPAGSFKTKADFHYQTLKANVDALKLIQLGLTFSDACGNLPKSDTGRQCVWQFNFREFDPEKDAYASASIDLLRGKGVDAQRFGELLMSSGVVLNDSVRWIAFHSGYDFGYLLKLLTGQNLPDTRAGFFELLSVFFPIVYDVKHLMKFCNSLHGGLNKLAESLDVKRFGVCHQAGSDSLLTSSVFRRLKELFFNGSPERYSGVVYGIDFEYDENKR